MISWVMIEIIATYHPSTVAANAMIDTENIIFLLMCVAWVYFKQKMWLMLDLKKLFKILHSTIRS